MVIRTISITVLDTSLEEEGEGRLGRGGLVMKFPYNFLIALTI